MMLMLLLEKTVNLSRQGYDDRGDDQNDKDSLLNLNYLQK